MQLIPNARIGSTLDFDHGEGYLTITWLDTNGIDRSLTIDMDGFCHREMPIRSGSGMQIIGVYLDRIHLRFTDQLAKKLELEPDIEFSGTFPTEVYADLERLTEYL